MDTFGGRVVTFFYNEKRTIISSKLFSVILNRETSLLTSAWLSPSSPFVIIKYREIKPARVFSENRIRKSSKLIVFPHIN